MAIVGDIISERVPGGETTPSPVTPYIKIGMICRSRGKATDTSDGIPHNLGSLDNFPTTHTYARKVFYAEDSDGDKYYPNVHFVVIDNASGDVVDPDNFGEHDNTANLILSWVNAPSMNAPSIIELTPIMAGGNYNPSDTVQYKILAIDKNSRLTNESLVKSYTFPSPAPGDSIIIHWTKVDYASGYRLVRNINGGGWEYKDITDPNQVTYTDDGGATGWSAYTPPATNDSRIEPPVTGYTLYYAYADFSLGPKEYTTWSDVVNDHGIGSEADNIAYIVLEQNKAPYLTIFPIYPTEDNLNAYINMLNYLPNFDVLFFGATYYSDTLRNMAIQQAESLSDKRNGQKERYFIYAHRNGETLTNIQNILSTLHSTTSRGKRVLFGVMDGGSCSIDVWREPDGSYSTNKTITDSGGSDITPIFPVLAMISYYSSLADPSEPMTEKSVSGFTLTGQAFSSTTIRDLSEKGACIFTTEEGSTIPVIYRSVLPALYTLGIEDGELSIAVTEDMMDIEIRRFLRQYRGKKALPKRLLTIKSLFIRKVLDTFVLREWITEYRRDSVNVWMDETDPTVIRGYFKYRPMYPINKLWFQHEFIV